MIEGTRQKRYNVPNESVMVEQNEIAKNTAPSPVVKQEKGAYASVIRL